jgi:polyisoprenoid-binding protein YceI
MKTLTFAAAAFATIAVTGGALVAGPALFAQGAPQMPGAQDASRVSGGSYALDPEHTLIKWKVDHFGFNDYFGLFGQITGTMQMDPANIEAARLEITVPVADVTVASAGLRDHLLRPGKDGGEPDFFGPSPAPARFVSTRVERTGDMTANVTGDLTLNGRTAPVTLEVEFSGAGANPMTKKENVGFHARGVMDRSQWGIDYAAPLVSREVELTISAAFEKQ